MTYVRKKTEKYLTLLEAQASARQLGIKSSSEYNRHYRTDPKLPACPDVEYSEAWQSWYDFCGTKRPAKKYAKLIQAKAAVRKLGINTSRAYRLRWQEDPRLPANPYIDYANDWISWYDFCGSEKPIEKYLTLSEARSAVTRLGISTVAHYNTDHHKDPKLPGDLRFYPEFTNWLDFIGKSRYKNFYQSICEASRAALAIGIDSHFSTLN